MLSATIKLFLPYGDAKRFRTAEIKNWTVKALAAPRTDLDILLKREELSQTGVYLLIGFNSDTEKPKVYIGEAEVIKDRLKQHIDKEFWTQAIVFVSKDENLTKAHVKYLEGSLIDQVQEIGKAELENHQSSGARLPESDAEDMKVFLSKIHQLLPVLGTDLFVPVLQQDSPTKEETLYCKIKGLVAEGKRTPNGFVIFKGSEVVPKHRKSTRKALKEKRDKLIKEGVLEAKKENGHKDTVMRCYFFTKNYEFSSPSLAAAIIHGGEANGLIAWKNDKGITLKDIENSEMSG